MARESARLSMDIERPAGRSAGRLLGITGTNPSFAIFVRVLACIFVGSLCGVRWHFLAFRARDGPSLDMRRHKKRGDACEIPLSRRGKEYRISVSRSGRIDKDPMGYEDMSGRTQDNNGGGYERSGVAMMEKPERRKMELAHNFSDRTVQV